MAEDFKYAEYLIEDPDTPKELLDQQERYLVLTAEERREWRYENLPKMSEICIWNFYWKYIRELEERDGETAILDEINQDVPHLDQKLKNVMEEYENTKKQYEQLLASRVEVSEHSASTQAEDKDMQ